MSWTKEQLIKEALDVLGLGVYNFDFESEQFESALRKLDTMIATWNGEGYRLPYPLHDSPAESTLDEDSSLPDYALEAVYLNLAIRIAPSYGKALTPIMLTTAKQAKDAIISRQTRPPEIQPNAMVAGQGSKYWRGTENPFISDQEDILTDGSSNSIDFN